MTSMSMLHAFCIQISESLATSEQDDYSVENGTKNSACTAASKEIRNQLNIIRSQGFVDFFGWCRLTKPLPSFSVESSHDSQALDLELQLSQEFFAIIRAEWQEREDAEPLSDDFKPDLFSREDALSNQKTSILGLFGHTFLTPEMQYEFGPQEMIGTFCKNILCGNAITMLSSAFDPHSVVSPSEIPLSDRHLPLAVFIQSEISHKRNCRAQRTISELIMHSLRPVLFQLLGASSADSTEVLGRHYFAYGVVCDEELFTIYACYPDVRIVEGKTSEWYIRIQQIRQFELTACISYPLKSAIMYAMLLIEKQCSVLRSLL